MTERGKGIVATMARWLGRAAASRNTAPLVSVPIVYVLLTALQSSLFEVGELKWLLGLDLGVHLAIAYALVSLWRRLWAFHLFVALAMSGMFLGHATKVVLLGGPLTPDDIESAAALVHIVLDVKPAAVVV